LRRPIFGGNWKMHKTIKEALQTIEELRGEITKLEGTEVVIFPPFTALSAVEKKIKGTDIALGAQNMYGEEKGAYTGEISPLMLLELVQE